MDNRVPNYLRMENMKWKRRNEIRTLLFKLRCGNLEEKNKYWLEIGGRISFLCCKRG